MKDAYYFPHDSNARNDPKISALICKYGYQGYGWYWAIIEILREQPDYKYPINKYTFDALAMQLQCERNAVVEFINDCCHEFATNSSALLCMDDENLWSESLIKRMKPVDEKRSKARESANKRWQQCERNANAMRTQCDGNASKVKESKVNKKIYKDVVKLTDEQYEKLEEKFGESLNEKLEDLSLYIKSKGEKYKCHYSTLLSWDRKHQRNKAPPEVKQGKSKYRDLNDYIPE